MKLMNMTSTMTMTLKEITDLLEVRHNDAMKKVDKMAESPDFGTVSVVDIQYSSGKGRIDTTKTYQLTLAQSMAVFSRLSKTGSVRLFESSIKSIEDFKSIVIAVNLFDAPDLPDRYVYAAQDCNGRIKIGISKDPEQRVKQLNVGHPDNLKLVYMAKAIDNTYLSEKEAHEKCKDYHLRSEWFSAPALELLNQH